MKNILITGSGGQLGYELQGLSYTHTYRGYKFFYTDIETLDITSEEKVKRFIKENEVNCIINCAAYTGVDKAESEPEAAMLVNGLAPGLLVSACAINNARMIHVSTDYVFDGSTPLPYIETNPANPLSVYGNTKLEGEKAVLNYEYGTVVRSSWLYCTQGKNFFNTILALASEKDHLNVVYDQVGTPTYAGDLARILLSIADISLSGGNTDISGLFHYSNEGVCSWYDFAFEIVSLTGRHCHINPVDTSHFSLPARRPHYSVLNKSKIRSHFSVDIPHWKESLINCIDQLDKQVN